MKKIVSIIAALAFLAVAGNAMALEQLNLNIYELTDGGNEIQINLLNNITQLDGTQSFTYNINLDDFLTDDCGELYVVTGGDVESQAGQIEYVGVIDTIPASALSANTLSTETAYLQNELLTGGNTVEGGQISYSNELSNSMAQRGGFQGTLVSSAQIPYNLDSDPASYTFNIYERTAEFTLVPTPSLIPSFNPIPVATVTVVCGDTPVIPVPAALLLLASGIVGLISLRKKNA
jgi:hypothetical protein